MHKTNKKLALRTQTVRKLDSTELAVPHGGMPPLTFFPCQTANCLTLGTLCPTHDCGLTFTSCACY